VHLWADDERGQIAFPAASVEEANRRAGELRALIADGVDPVVRANEERLARQREQAEALERQAAAEQLIRDAELERSRRITVRQLFERWQLTELQQVTRADGTRTGRKDGGNYVRQQFERHVFPGIGAMACADIRKADILSLIDTQKAKQQMRTAAVLLSDLRQMMAFALDRELIDADPLASIRKARIVGTTVERDRVLSEDEIQLLGKALATARLSRRSEAAIWLILSTGSRIGELMGAIWSDSLPNDPLVASARLSYLQTVAEEDGVKIGVVDLAAKRWHLPDTKNQRDHTIHLSEFALGHMAHLRDLREVLPDCDEPSPWLFPARDSRRPVCVKSFGKQLSDRQREADKRMSGRSKSTSSLCLPGGKWTAHDLRRTTGTLLASIGVSGDVIDECLNHKIESRIRRTYIRDRRLGAQQMAFDALGVSLSRLSGR
jgi:integrase